MTAASLSSPDGTSNSNLQEDHLISLDNGKTMMVEGSCALHELLVAKVEPALGRPLSQMDIRFRDLSLTADMIVIGDEQTRLAAKNELPTLANVLKKIWLKLSAEKHTFRREILKDITGEFRPGTMTLVLGQPGSGKSALMKVLSGRFPIKRNITLEGEMTYNGVDREVLLKKLPQMAAYVTQRDHHFATLTVKETFEFAHKCCGGDLPKPIADRLVHGTPEQNKEAYEVCSAVFHHSPEIVIEYLGLDICKDTIIGNHMLRGVSGGERKRVTLGEMEFGRTYATFMDEVSTGLDSAAAYDIINTERSVAQTLHKTVVICLLQPPPEVYKLFDDVILLNEGQVMYHGPVGRALEYFEGLGLKCPPERDTADFLLDLGTNMQAPYETDIPAGSLVRTAHPPRDASEYADLFRRSSTYRAMLERMDQELPKEWIEDAEILKNRLQFNEGLIQSTITLMARESKIILRNRPFLFGRSLMVTLMGLFFATLFYQFDPENVQVVLGLMFASQLFVSLGQASQIPTFMVSREIFYKQRAASFYRTFSYVFANTVGRIPLGIIESVVFGSITYWLCGYVSNVRRFLVFEVILFLTNLCFGSWFFMVSAMAPNLHIAKPVAMLTIVLFIVTAGYVITPNDMHDYFKWLYWINPIAWGFRAMAVNQYMAPEFNEPLYKGLPFVMFKHKPMGEYYLDIFGISPKEEWALYGALYLFFCYLVFVVGSFVGLEFIRYETWDNAGFNKKKTGEEQDASKDKTTEEYVAVQTPKSGATEEAVAVPIETVERKKNFTPVTLAFTDLWYTVPLPGGKKGETIDLLKGISGYAVPGSITALMGSTGAGKTTLMDVIAGRKNVGKIRGNILLNGFQANELAIRRATGYCEQMDVHSEASTFREALTFSSFLRQSHDIPDSVKYDSVDESIELLGLEPIADKIIRGSSVEQMKRLTIGVELAAQPSVLFLDEPTSGLDARSAKLIMDGVRKVADTGRTVVCTIHQPSKEVFHLFDMLLLLKRGGEMVFFGDLGEKANKLVDYFEAVPGVAKCPEHYNPATWMLEVIGAGVGNGAAEGKDFVKVFNESENKRLLDDMLTREGVSHPAPGVAEVLFSEKRAATEWTQARFLIQRFWRIYWRTASYNITRLFISVFLGILFGLLYLNAKFVTYTQINSGIGMVFLTTGFLGVVSLNSVLPLMSEERSSFYRERSCQTFNALWFFVGATIVEIPYTFFSTLLFTAIFFPMAGFTGLWTFVQYWVDLVLLVLLQTYMGQLLVFATPSVEVAAIFGVLVNSISLLFMGYVPPADAIPTGYNWLYQITPQRYTLSFLVSLVFGKCDQQWIYDEAARAHANHSRPHLTPAMARNASSDIGCQVLGGENTPTNLTGIPIKFYLEDTFNMHEDNMVRDFLMSIVFIVVLRIMGLLAMRYLNFQKR